MTGMAASEFLRTTGIDSVYFFAWPGFERELRSNRWYYARLWSTVAPVVLLQPSQGRTQATALRRDARLANVTIAHIRGADAPPLGLGAANVAYGIGQASEIAGLQARLGHARPLFWGYDPHLAYPYAAMPAVARVYHATENYFDFQDADEAFLDVLRGMLRASSLIIACSSGVSEAIARQVATVPRLTVSNGCDYAFFATPREPPAALAARLGGIQARGPVAVFAGNINHRIDFALVGAVAAAMPSLQLLFVGPVEPTLPRADAQRWGGLLARPNVHHLPPVEVEDLPWIYARSSIGIIPYRSTRVITENGFPLKALEMLAAGLPVVATTMRPLEALADVITTTAGAEAFIGALQSRLAAGRTDAFRQRAATTCQEYDYEARFGTVLAAVAASCPPALTAVPGAISGFPALGPWQLAGWGLAARMVGFARRWLPQQLIPLRARQLIRRTLLRPR